MENKKIIGYNYDGSTYENVEAIFETLYQNGIEVYDTIGDIIYPVYYTSLEIEAEDLIDDIIDGLCYKEEINEKGITSDDAVKDLQEMINSWLNKYGTDCVETLDKENKFDFPVEEFILWKCKKDIENYVIK